LLQVNLDVQVASQTILGALPEIKALRERMVKELPAFDAAQFDKLEDYSGASPIPPRAGEWMKPKSGRTPIVVVSVAHLDDQERALVLGVLLEEFLSWVRTLPGSQRLRALLVFDEVYGFLPPHPNNPPTKRPLVALMKQARGFGVGVVVATQNPMDLDYRALSNAGLWFLGRLQTDADRARVLDGLAAARGTEQGSNDELATTLQRLAPRWFVVRNPHTTVPPLLMQPRYAMSLMRGPMTRSEIRRARGVQEPTRVGAMPDANRAAEPPAVIKGKNGESIVPHAGEARPS
jgi:hypothetical protein